MRANENIALTAMQTLFAREHNRIVAPAARRSLAPRTRFQIARRVVGAEQQYITYNEFLPAIGVALRPYTRLPTRASTPRITNEFATVGYRAHSHDPRRVRGRGATPALLGRPARRASGPQGVEVEPATAATSSSPSRSNVAFFNPDLLQAIGLGPILAGLGAESQYRNDEQIDNPLRSVLFQVPGPGNPDPACVRLRRQRRSCFNGVVDLGAIDIERGRDHGMPTYNDAAPRVRAAAKTSFTAITGEWTDSFAGPSVAGPDRRPGDPGLRQHCRRRRQPDHAGRRRGRATSRPASAAAPLAARLQGGLRRRRQRRRVRRHGVRAATCRAPSSASCSWRIWSRQFEALRDGDRFFYGNDPALEAIRRRYGITYKHTLADLILRDSDAEPADVTANVFLGTGTAAEPAPEQAPERARPAKKPARGRGDRRRGQRPQRRPARRPGRRGRGRPQPRVASAPASSARP